MSFPHDVPAQQEICAVCRTPIPAGTRALYLEHVGFWGHLACAKALHDEVERRCAKMRAVLQF